MASVSPAVPEASHAEFDSMLSRKFGREVANYFSGSPLNRVSFLRTEHNFLASAFKHASTSFILFHELKPLVSNPSALAFLKRADVEGFVGHDPFTKSEKEMIADFDSSVTLPQMIFLGLDERDMDGLVWKETYKGAPLFAVDVTPKGTIKEQASKIITEMESRGLKFLEGRMILSFPAIEAAVYAQARAMIDWNNRNPFCAACGHPTLSVNGGGKRVCPPKDASKNGAEGADPPQCVTMTGISNLSFPRTDPTVIMGVVNSAGTHIMLGRQKRWPPYWYSTLAGFLEPGESVEEAVRREVWEEAGVTIGRVVIHSTQPWPYPANLMIGAIGQTIPKGEKIDLGNDPELDDAKWVSFDELREALKIGISGLGDPPGPEYKEGGLRLPPPTAIANQLMTAAVSGFLSAEHKI